MSFASRLAALVAERRSQVVLGLDPDPARVWPEALAADPGRGSVAERAAEVVVAHCAAVVAAAGPACVAAKLQVASFERLGAPGWAALERVVGAVRAAGLLVVADAKRGDIDVSAAAYAQAHLGQTPTPFGVVAGLGADALTVSPYLGADALAPFAATGAGLFVLVRTSNPGAADLQDRRLEDGGAVWEQAARLVDRLGADRPPPRLVPDGHLVTEPLADVGAVMGATAPLLLARARELMPRAVFLLPGVGAQGGRVEDLAPAFAPGPAGGLVTASRAIVHAHERFGGPGPAPAEAARAAAEELRGQAWALAHPG